MQIERFEQAHIYDEIVQYERTTPAPQILSIVERIISRYNYEISIIHGLMLHCSRMLQVVIQCRLKFKVAHIYEKTIQYGEIIQHFAVRNLRNIK